MNRTVRNVYIFVADSLRWDHLPDRARSHGEVYRTVTQSLYSPASFATLATGLYPQQHGVTGWRKQFPEDVRTIFDVEGISGGFYQESGTVDDPIYDAVSVDRKTRMDELEPPFVYVERDMTPHVPFDGYESTAEYFDAVAGDRERLRTDYAAAAEESFEKYRTRVEELRDRFGGDDTLFVYTSDHGELLGERGDVVHTFPACPELVYVPTVFTYPGQEDAKTDTTVDGIVEHVDVVETVASRLPPSEFSTEGVDLFEERRERDWGYNHTHSTRNGMDFYTADSLWWEDGGHVEQTNRRTERLLLAAYMLTRSAESAALRTDPLELLRTYVSSTNRFGDPPLAADDCRDILAGLRADIETRDPATRELSASSQERLEDLGYIQ